MNLRPVTYTLTYLAGLLCVGETREENPWLLGDGIKMYKYIDVLGIN